MLAGVYRGVRNIQCREVDKPEIGDNEALVKVRAAAVCGTDVKIYRYGHRAIEEGEERILGHEFAGHVEKVGTDVTPFHPGDRVTAEINISCGTCPYCLVGLQTHCENVKAIGIFTNGAFAEYIALPQSNVHCIPETLEMNAKKA